jgi:mono/diheme cytochrome c family protein
MCKSLSLLGIAALLLGFVACDSMPLRKSDAELGLTPVQASGRHIFDRQCGQCHEAYTSKPLKGPSLMGMYKRPYLKMGAPANDDRVREIIVVGRAKMPAFGHVLNDDEIDKLIAYLHTL